jgi:hypothetical protein
VKCPETKTPPQGNERRKSGRGADCDEHVVALLEISVLSRSGKHAAQSNGHEEGYPKQDLHFVEENPLFVRPRMSQWATPENVADSVAIMGNRGMSVSSSCGTHDSPPTDDRFYLSIRFFGKMRDCSFCYVAVPFVRDLLLTVD